MSTRYTLAALILLMSLPVYAQEDVLYPYPSTFPLTFGIEIGPNFSLFSQNVSHSPIDNPTSPNRALESGSGLGGFIVVQSELPLGDRFALQARSGFELKRFTSRGQGVADCPQNPTDVFDTLQLDVRRTSTTGYFTSGIFLRADIAGGFFATIGPVLHRWTGTMTIDDRFEILPPSPCNFAATGSKVAEVETTDSTSLNIARLGIEGGIGFKIPLSENLWLTPAVRFQFMIDPLGPDGDTDVDNFRGTTLGDLNLRITDQTLHALHFGLGIWWHP